MRNRLIAVVAAVMASMGLMSRHGAWGAVMVLSGDNTPAFSLTNTNPDPAVAGNQQFFTNLLDGGTNVLVLNSSNSTAATEINQFYNSLPGKVCVAFSGTITPALLSGEDLVVLPVPDHAFTASEAAALQAFYAGGSGKSVLIMGEGTAGTLPFAAATDANINNLLAQMAVPLSLGIMNLDNGSHNATAAQILSDPLTVGVTSYHYGATASVNGGTALFLTTNSTPMAAYLPEPGAVGAVVMAMIVLVTARGARLRERQAPR